MRTLNVSGIWDFYSGCKAGAVYKYQILSCRKILMKSDRTLLPVLRFVQITPSVVADLNVYHWILITATLSYQETRQSLGQKPMAIYEMHLGSWRKRVEDDDNGFFSYRACANDREVCP